MTKSIICFLTGHKYFEINRHCGFNTVNTRVCCERCSKTIFIKTPRIRQGDNKPIQRHRK